MKKTKPSRMRGNPAVSPFGDITRKMYPGVFRDTNGNQIPDVDDADLDDPHSHDTVEEVRLSEEIGALIDERAQYVDAMHGVTHELAHIGRKIMGDAAGVKGRVKTPYSAINKLRVWALPKLKDFAGARLTFPNYKGVEAAVQQVLREMDVVDGTFKNLYEHPEGGYRAYHMVVRMNGMPVEVQIKTDRMAKIGDMAHTLYKTKKLDPEVMDRATDLAHKADMGDPRAAQEIDAWLSNKRKAMADLSR